MPWNQEWYDNLPIPTQIDVVNAEDLTTYIVAQSLHLKSRIELIDNGCIELTAAQLMDDSVSVGKSLFKLTVSCRKNLEIVIESLKTINEQFPCTADSHMVDWLENMTELLSMLPPIQATILYDD